MNQTSPLRTTRSQQQCKRLSNVSTGTCDRLLRNFCTPIFTFGFKTASGGRNR